MDGPDRPAGQGGGLEPWEIQDHRADDRPHAVAVPARLAGPADLPDGRVADGGGSDPDADLDGDLPAQRRAVPGPRTLKGLKRASLAKFTRATLERTEPGRAIVQP